ncbi:MAG TPA: hypothetical protein V6C57_17020, partial [Coleofasciculaceae cyanobacterium]
PKPPDTPLPPTDATRPPPHTYYPCGGGVGDAPVPCWGFGGTPQGYSPKLFPKAIPPSSNSTLKNTNLTNPKTEKAQQRHAFKT